MDLSIIIPMYNIENYIEECIKNLIDIKISEKYEVIIINDGSTDSSKEVAMKCIEGLNNFKVCDKPNGGLSSARNMGVKESQGKYVYFLDGDDFIDIKEIVKMLEVALLGNLDILIGNGMYYYDDTNRCIKFHQGRKMLHFKQISSGKEVMNYMIEKKCYKIEVCDKLYKKELIIKNNLLFEEGFLHEDELFTPLALIKAEKVKYYGDILYYYRQRMGSINHTIKLKNCLDYIRIANILYSLDEGDDRFNRNLKIRVMQQYLRAMQLSLSLENNDYIDFCKALNKSNFKECRNMKNKPITITVRIMMFENFRKTYGLFYVLYKKIRFLTIGKA